jgi:aspartyl-tRNA(Asn)/glutamyl-tRNA(Gln) amidotransferase subunit A
MTDLLSLPLPRIAEALRERAASARELTEAALERHADRGERLHAYKVFDVEGALAAADRADDLLTHEPEPPPLCGIPYSAKDLYGARGLPTFAGTARRLPDVWSNDAWLVGRLRAQGAVLTGKTHTVELAFGGVGINPHWGTPVNPWDADVHRIPGGSSCGAGVSLWEGSALLALGTDTAGSIRIPASLTATVGHKTTKGRWPTDGVVPLSGTFDSVGTLSRSVEDSVYFFGAIDRSWGDPAKLLDALSDARPSGLRIAVPRCAIWEECQPDIAGVLQDALAELSAAGARIVESDGALLDEACRHYMTGGIAASECRDFLARELPGWIEILHPIVGSRIEAAAYALSDPAYAAALEAHHRLAAAAPTLFEDAPLLALPAGIITPPPVAELDDLSRYGQVNASVLRPTAPVSMLGLCAIAMPVGLDAARMPVGLQLVAPGGADEALLAAALAAERVLGTGRDRLGVPPAPRLNRK